MATKWGIVSAGKISHDFVNAVRSMQNDDNVFVAVAAREISSAERFASLHNIPKAYGSYNTLAKDPDIDVAYIGCITSQHFPVAKLMLENGKNVLVEKPMTLNAKQTKELIQIAQARNLFLMEAIWSRFLPSYKFLMELIRDGTIGDVVHIHASLGIPLIDRERIVKKQYGGGTILDLGIYPLNAVSMIYDEKPVEIASVGHLNEDGVDLAMSSSLKYSKNRTATVTTSGITELPNELVITGTRGRIKVPNSMYAPEEILVSPDEKQHKFSLPSTLLPGNFPNSSGLRYEAVEVTECLKKGKLESSIMPLKDSLMLAEIMDEIRKQIGVAYDED
ncbi:trans-1,2-dihydrobenzene-1,2-diol dehydrogenase-like isoform X1 [Uloborus diversus]|uniref:trans-1,2-dihydrobenzene-1,2-diol dehydrogenase-like isoform X1 n=1 Tax=Uloborus diversus TaxID=327109 RepID=UPI00240A4CCE|nr:trans-1,2-dihydrobenzene-1,2-diol dehydrogenase-like isoform X1 [Uloborus diversus]